MTTLSHDYETAVNSRACSLGVRLVPLIRSKPPRGSGWVLALGFVVFVAALMAIRG